MTLTRAEAKIKGINRKSWKTQHKKIGLLKRQRRHIQATQKWTL